MLTKHKFWYAKQAHGSWKHVITVDFCASDISTLKRERRKYLTQMTEQYGPQSERWSVRWTDYGADVRFRTDEDAASFHMFFTR